MKVSLMQKVDYWCGIPLCMLLSFWHAIVSRLLPAAKSPVQKILFVELSEMGSAILAYSSLAKAPELVPGAEVYFLIFERNRESVELLRTIPDERVLVISDSNFFVFACSALATLFKIRRIGIDSVLDLELFSRFTAIYGYLTGAKTRIGFHNYTDEGLFRGNFLTHPVFYNQTQHISLNFLNLVQALTADASERPMIKRDVRGGLRPLPQYAIPDADKNKMWSRLAAVCEKCTPGTQLIILNPDPGLLELRGWAVEKYADLSRRLLAAHPRAVLLVVGLSRSRQYADEIFHGLDAQRTVDFCGKTDSMADLLVLMSIASALVTSDSGPGHIASLVNLQTFVFFGPESPLRYAPLGDHVKTFYAHLSCSPCYSAANHRRSICRDNQCMKQIPVDPVFAEISGFLAKDASARI